MRTKDWIIFFLFPLLCLTRNTEGTKLSNTLPNVTEFVETKLQDYDRYQMPAWSEGKPVKLQLGFYIESLSEFRESSMTFRIDIYLRMAWVDSRLAHNSSSYILLNDKAIANKLWLPDIYIANAQKSTFHDVTKPNQLLRVLKDGSIQYSIHVGATLSCNLKLAQYPVDYQQCFVKMLSYGYCDQWLKIEWMGKNAVEINPAVVLPEMKLQSITTAYCNETYIFNNTTYVFSCLQATASVKRQIGYHVLQTYIPSGLIVIVSWASFWIDPAAVPARTGLCITTLLTITSQAAGIRASLPPVSYAKAIDFWVGLCTIMIFGSLLEYILVNSLLVNATACSVEEKMRKKLSKRKTSQSEATANQISEQEIIKVARKGVKRALMVDTISKVLFPSVFVISNLIYWLKLTSVEFTS